MNCPGCCCFRTRRRGDDDRPRVEKRRRVLCQGLERRGRGRAGDSAGADAWRQLGSLPRRPGFSAIKWGRDGTRPSRRERSESDAADQLAVPMMERCMKENAAEPATPNSGLGRSQRKTGGTLRRRRWSESVSRRTYLQHLQHLPERATPSLALPLSALALSQAFTCLMT